MAHQKVTAAAGLVGALGRPAPARADEEDNNEGERVRWDFPNVFTPCTTPGGHASARAQDGARITIAGSGTFPNVRNRCSRRVTGGGTWTITPGTASGCFSGSGTFKVTELLNWVVAPGVFPPSGCDGVGPAADARPGLAELRVRYSNGTTGTLTLSCHLFGTPDCVFEGITASMDFEDFWNTESPAPGVEGNRTVFHVVRENDDDDDHD